MSGLNLNLNFCVFQIQLLSISEFSVTHDFLSAHSMHNVPTAIKSQYSKAQTFFFHVSIVKPSQSLPSALRNLDTVGVISLRYLWDTLHNTNNLVPVMLCQYPRTQDGCCYYFVISTFRREPQRSRCRAPECQLMTGQLEKSSKFVTADREPWWIWEGLSVHNTTGCRHSFSSHDTVDAQHVAAGINSCQKISKEIKRTKFNVPTEYIVIRNNLARVY